MRTVTVNGNGFEVEGPNVDFSTIVGLAGHSYDSPVVAEWTHPDFIGGKLMSSNDWIPLEEGMEFTVRERTDADNEISTTESSEVASA